MKTSGFIALILFFIVSLSGCSKQNSMDNDGVAKGAKQIIYLRKTPCYGRCPSFEATIYDNGQVLYHGKAAVNVIGRFLYQVPASSLAKWQNEARYIKYNEFKKEYMVNPDLPSTITSIYYDGKTHTVEVQGNAPDALRKYQTDITEYVLNLVASEKGKKLPDLEDIGSK